MRDELPLGHGLPSGVVATLLFTDEEGRPSLTDVQHAALQAGIGRGESVLVVSPTSTGKTQIGVWALAIGLERGRRTVYLVTHRALARQKFDDFKSSLLEHHLGANDAALVIATGDYVEDAGGHLPADPLQAPLLVATYEKYLGLLSGSGTPTNMSETVIVCDEIQLLGDEHRGQGVEVLLTFLKNAKWGQFVGLSAVLDERDSNELANWLGVRLIRERNREKHLRYECWTPTGILGVSTDRPEYIGEGKLPAGVERTPLSAVTYLRALKPAPLPIIVFCMSKAKTYELAEQYSESLAGRSKGQLSLAFDGLPATSANAFLAKIIEQRVACHSADLLDDEREIIERLLVDGKLDVVFATSTLAAGVNFPLGAAVFADWGRWDGTQRVRVPIPASEFHNMSGRVGRMGFGHAEGRVIYFASEAQELRPARTYLELDRLTTVSSRIQPRIFKQLALQIVSSGVCRSLSEVSTLICSTFSALREETNNLTAFSQWPARIAEAVIALKSDSLLVESSNGTLSATPIGKAIGYSGLMPETGVFLLNYLQREGQYLAALLPSDSGGDLAQLAFHFFEACFSSPEFIRQQGLIPTRFIPWPLEKSVLFDPTAFSNHLAEPIWRANVVPINAARLSVCWIEGQELTSLEGMLPNLTAGMLGDLYRNLAWTLQGLAAIAFASVDKTHPHFEGALKDAVSKLPRAIRRLARRVQVGLPDDVLWLPELNNSATAFRIGRHEILGLRSASFAAPHQLMLGSPEADAVRVKVFEKAKPTPLAKSNWARDASRKWKSDERTRRSDRLLRRAKHCPRVDLIQSFFSSKGTDFEKAFEDALTFLKVDFTRLDEKGKTGAPDYLLKLDGCPGLVVELKSKQGDKLVDYNSAVEVLAASEVHGHKTLFCVTVCHPGVDPSVPSVIANCGRLSVVESADLGESLVRLCEKAISHNQLWQWLATPGQGTTEDLPYAIA